MGVELRENNLYRNGEIVSFEDTGEELLLREPLVIIPSEQDEYYLVKALDRLDLIASKKYGKYVPDASKYWWVIADANGIQEPLDLSEYLGKQILIPNILNVLLQL